MPVPRLNLSIFSGDHRSRKHCRKSSQPSSSPPSPRTASPEKCPPPEFSESDSQIDTPQALPREATLRPPLVAASLSLPSAGELPRFNEDPRNSYDSGRSASLGSTCAKRASLESAPIRYSRSGTYIDGGEMSEEVDIYEYFKKFVHQYNPNDVLVYGRTRREAVQQYGHIRHFWLIELWSNVGLRYLFGNSMFASREVYHRANVDGAQILHLTGFSSNQHSWIVASDHPTAVVHGYRLKSIWPKYVAKPKTFAGPDNFFCEEGASYIDLPYEDNTFEVISSRSAAYVTPSVELDKLFRELYRVTKPGGQVELFFRVRDLEMMKNFGRTPEEFMAYEVEWKAALKRSQFEQVRRARVAIPECWGSDVHYVTELILLFYRIIQLQHNTSTFEPPSEAMLDRLVRLNKPTGTVAPVTIDIYTMQKPL